jgi:hypothetical protein
MPLVKSKSEKAFSKNVKAEIAAGKPQKQAVAIAYSVKRAAKKARGGSMNPHDYDSDWDYQRATGQLGSDENEPEQQSRRSVMAEQKRKETEKRKNRAGNEAGEMYRASDKEESLRQFGRVNRRNESGRLMEAAKRLTKSGSPTGGLIANKMRKDWSEKIGGGKPAPFKSGGKAKSCW